MGYGIIKYPVSDMGTQNKRVEMADGEYTARSYLLQHHDLSELNYLLTSSTFLQDAKLLFNKPSEYILSLRYYPIKFDELLQITTPLDRKVQIMFGGKQYTDVLGIPLHRYDEYTLTFTSSRLKIDEYYGDFLDYDDATTKIEIYIPYIGYRTLPTAFVMGRYIDVTYTIDFFSGQLTAYVLAYDSMLTTEEGYLIDFFNTQIGIDVPLGSTNASDIARNNLNLGISSYFTALGIGTGIALKDSKSLLAGIKGIGNVANSAINNNVKHFTPSSTNATACGNLHMNTKLHVKITRIEALLPTNYIAINGLPLENTVALDTLSGYTEIGIIYFDANGSDIYNDEINEIVTLLQQGVIL